MLTSPISVNLFIPSWSIYLPLLLRVMPRPQDKACVSDPSPAFPQHSLRGLDIGRNLKGASQLREYKLGGSHSSYFFLQWWLEAKVSAIWIPKGAGSRETIEHYITVMIKDTRNPSATQVYPPSIHHSPNQHWFGTDSGHCRMFGVGDVDDSDAAPGL